jgi:hypothetical protein
MGQLGKSPISASIYQGLPLKNTPPDCPDTSLQHHSRHWITSFQIRFRYLKGGTFFRIVKSFYTVEV